MRRDARRLLRLAGAIGSLVLGSAMTIANASALLSAGPREATSVELSDDDEAAALFSATGLAPGHPVSSCMAVTYGADGSSAFHLYGQSDSTGLERSLGLTVEMGTGGRFGDCAGFQGEAVYQGTLGDFASRYTDFEGGLALDVPEDGAVTGFRFTADVLDDDTAQGTEAVATFTWESRPAPPPAVGVSPIEVPTIGAPAQEVTAPTTTIPATSAPAIATLSPEPKQSTAGAQPRARLTPLSDSPSSPLEALARGVALVARTTAFPGVLLLVAAVFLLVQDRIDRKDPKLALAPLYADPDLRFDGPVDR